MPSAKAAGPGAPIVQPAPELAEGWMVGTSPTMTTRGGRGGRLALVAAPGARQAALPDLRGRPHRVGHRLLDPAGGAGLAGVPPDAIDLPARRHGLPAQHLLSAAGTRGRPHGRPPATPEASDRHRPVPGGLLGVAVSTGGG